MPLYEVKCSKCERTYELICSFDSLQEELKKKCACGGDFVRTISSPGMVTIHDMQGKADLFHRRTSFKDGSAHNTTDGYGSRYYYKNNPSEDPKVLKRKMEKSKKGK